MNMSKNKGVLGGYKYDQNTLHEILKVIKNKDYFKNN